MFENDFFFSNSFGMQRPLYSIMKGLLMSFLPPPDSLYSKFDKKRFVIDTILISYLQGSSEDLGFELGLGRDDNAVVVRNVTPGTAAFQKLR